MRQVMEIFERDSKIEDKKELVNPTSSLQGTVPEWAHAVEGVIGGQGVIPASPGEDIWTRIGKLFPTTTHRDRMTSTTLRNLK